MSEQIRQIAQANDPILNNLVNTENKLTELNQEFGSILGNYQTTNTVDSSFFNFDNPFFLLTLAGLFMLLFALWFLKHELKYNKKNTPVVRQVPYSKLKKETELVKIDKLIDKPSSKNSKKIIKSRVRKIKVVKVK